MPAPKYPFQPAVLDAMPDEIAAVYRQLELDLLESICSRLKFSGELNESVVQAMRALRAHGISQQEIEEAVRRASGLGRDQLDDLLSDVVQRNQQFYTRLIDMAELTQPETLLDAATLEAIRRQAQNGLRNLTRSMGFLVGGQSLTPVSGAYQWSLDNALVKIQSGAWDYNTAIEDSVRQLADSGLKAVTYESGAVSALDVAVRRAVMTGVNQINQKYRDQSMEYLGTDLVEVTAHLGARNIDGPKGWENHARWQGKVYTTAQLRSVCGQGDVQGIGGANCRHSYWPFLQGISERTYTDAELESMKPENRPKITFDGRTYDEYEASQMQRRLEASYRKQRRREAAFTASGNTQAASLARARRIALSRKYRAFSEAAHLPEQRARMKVIR